MSLFDAVSSIAGIRWLESEEDAKRYFGVKSQEQEQEQEREGEAALTIIDDVGGGIVTVDGLVEDLVSDAKSGTGRVYLIKGTADLNSSAFGFYLWRKVVSRLGLEPGPKPDPERVRVLAAVWYFNPRVPNDPGYLVFMDDRILENPELEIAEALGPVVEMLMEDRRLLEMHEKDEEKDWFWGFHYPLVITTSSEVWDGVIKVLFANGGRGAITSEEHRQLFRTLYNEGKVIRRLTLLKKPETKWLYG